MVEVVCPRCKATLPADAWRNGPIAVCPSCHGHVALPAHVAVTMNAAEAANRPRSFFGGILHGYFALGLAGVLVVMFLAVGALAINAWLQSDSYMAR